MFTIAICSSTIEWKGYNSTIILSSLGPYYKLFIVKNGYKNMGIYQWPSDLDGVYHILEWNVWKHTRLNEMYGNILEWMATYSNEWQHTRMNVWQHTRMQGSILEWMKCMETYIHTRMKCLETYSNEWNAWKHTYILEWNVWKHTPMQSMETYANAWNVMGSNFKVHTYYIYMYTLWIKQWQTRA